MTRRLHGSCNVPIGGYCVESETGLVLWGLVGDAASGRVLRAEARGSADSPDDLGRTVAHQLLAMGAGAMLPR